MPEVAIIGGGPGGSTIATYLAQAGVDVAIYEKAIHPRFHIGESLVPSTSRVFEEIGFLETMEKEGFNKKPGAAWHPSKTSGLFKMIFKDYPLEGVDQDYTYHVERAKFDLALLKHAQKSGAKIFQGVGVREVLFDEETQTANGIRVDISGQKVDIPAKIVVDASGRNTILGTQLGLKGRDPIFNQFAVHAWYENADLGPEHAEDYIHIYFLPAERGWAWQIPISETVTSFGVVAEKEVFKQSGKKIGDWFEDMVRTNPDLEKALVGATKVRDYAAEADYSYSMKKFAGNGFVLIGDAARFVDPIFSSGVSVAIHSAAYAKDSILKALETGDVSESAFDDYTVQLKSGVDVWYEFILLYYKLLHLFTHFVTHPQYKLEILRLLSGDVYDRSEVDVLDAMREKIATIENTPNHLLKDYIGDIPIDFRAGTDSRLPA
ncbi:MAG: NAD(P)/FAD-dependent oxidoreductase [Acidimicrobiia bacterium]|nr:NAD(P)/FAD-dependent oxidoreductase [Acidimicrobiia bacterium]